MTSATTARFARHLALTASLLLPLSAGASYAERAEGQAFIQEMVERHGFDADELGTALARASHEPDVIRLITPPSKRGVRSWRNYRARFLDPIRVRGGVAFWDENAALLERASEHFGVPPEIIVAIIGVETVYGRHTGNFETMSALATLAFDYPRRAELFRGELEALFLMAREQRRDPASYYGSYAGALGYPQFLPSSLRAYAVDFDGNGEIDFESDPYDAIGSVANYLHVHGWQPGAPIAERARFAGVVDPAPLVAAGIEPALDPGALASIGVTTIGGSAPASTATLVDLESPNATTEYWLGYRNFYVITRYNRSSFYAMSVFELAETIRRQRDRLAATGR
ncbi:lytic murein transglycosylase B [Thauera phenolivorans]|uniref:lytic murein transglycosylase B n=1 Tax=Thauera phenolivorans TaxID=1792543 RepID=UPI00083A7DBE|nr:lytic murein transglycosylase B [Thauera phenolivorans]